MAEKRETFFSLFLFVKFTRLRHLYEILRVFPHTIPIAHRPLSLSLSLFAGRIFYAHAKKTYAENVCTRTRSTRLPRWRFLAPLYPHSFPNVSHPPHLSSTITSSPLCPLSLCLSLLYARAQVLSFFLLSLRSLTVISLSGFL